MMTVADTLAKLDELQYGVVVLDIGLPGGEVERVVERIAAIPATQRPVVLILAHHPEATRSLDVEIVQIVLRKPVVISHIVDLVRSCLRSAAARHESLRNPKKNGDQLTS